MSKDLVRSVDIRMEQKINQNRDRNGLEETRHTTKYSESDAEPVRKPVNSASDERDPDFHVTEANGQETGSVGVVNSSADSDLGIQSPTDLMEAEALRNGLDSPSEAKLDLGPIGESDPTLPEPMPELEGKEDLERVGVDSPTVPETNGNGLEKLSQDRINEISRRMKAESDESDYLSEDEKMQLINGMESSIDATSEPGTEIESKPVIGFDNSPIIPPKKKERTPAEPAPSDLPESKVEMSKRLRGIAYYAKGYIQVTGEQELHEGDELIINHREYLLKKKRVSNKMLAIVGGPLAAILIFALGTLFSSDADTGAGSIIGVALDNYDQPLISGGSIYLPEQDATIDVNAQGFFRTDKLDAGSYKIELLFNGEVVATDYATVVDDEVTTLTMRPEEVIAESAPPARPTTVNTPPPQVAKTPPAKPKSTTSGSSKPKSSKQSGRSGAATSRYAKLALAANVEGARLIIDGKVVGAGNLTYTELSPGQHSYTIEKTGYRTEGGSVRLTAGQTSRLEVALEPLPPAQPAVAPEQELYDAAMALFTAGDYEGALNGLNETIATAPGFALAYRSRAEVHHRNRDPKAAHDDLIRSADLYRNSRSGKEALAAYQDALNINPKSIPAHLGRGDFYLSRNEQIAAVADFEMVVRLDKRNIDGYLGLGRARYSLGYYDKAIKHFKDARSVDSKNPMVYQELTLSYYRDGEIKKAKESYDKFLEYASAEQTQQMNADSKYTAVLQAIGN